MADTPTIAPIKKPTPPAPPVPPRSSTLQNRAPWEAAILRAIADGERRINTLLKIGGNAGLSDKKTVRNAVLNALGSALPPGVSDCVRKRVWDAEKQPDIPDVDFTGRYESRGISTGNPYFWAINQAGNAVIAIRTLRDYLEAGGVKLSEQYVELRGDLQGDGTALLFQTNVTNNNTPHFGYLQKPVRGPLRWNFGSYLGAKGKRIDVENRPDDEELDLVGERPTMMESLFRSDNQSLTILLREREWYPLTKARYQFLEQNTRSSLLRTLLEVYLETPDGFTYHDKLNKDAATARLVSFVAYLLWDGQHATEPDPLVLPPEREDAYRAELAAYLEAARKIRHGHHNNLSLARHVAKIGLSNAMLNTGQTKQSFLDHLVTVARRRNTAGSPGGKKHAEALSRLLQIPLEDSSTGIHRYHLKLDVIRWLGFKVDGNLVIEPLTEPKWGRTSYDVSGWWAGRPMFDDHDVLFDLDIETPQQWLKEDFEGKILIGDLTLALETKWFKIGTGSVKGAYLWSDNNKELNLETTAGPTLEPGQGKNMIPSIKASGGGLFASVSVSKSKMIDLSTPYPASITLTKGLNAAAHFCFGDSFLTPTGRQHLRVVCADQLAALSSKKVDITIIGHTDRPASPEYNKELSLSRAKNVKTALVDILGEHPNGVLQIHANDIHAYGLGELEKAIKDWLKGIPDKTAESMRDPYSRRVDLFINTTLVATFRDSPLPP